MDKAAKIACVIALATALIAWAILMPAKAFVAE